MKKLQTALLAFAVSIGCASSVSAQVTASQNPDGSIHVVGTVANDSITVDEIAGELFVYSGGLLVDTFPVPALFTTAVTIDGLDGDDRLETKTSLITELNGGPGNDNLYGGDSADILRGGPGDDNLYGRLGFDELIGGDGDDYLKATPFTGDDNNGNRLDGGPGEDTLIGSPLHADVFIANDGELDQLEGHCGDESLFIDEGLDNLRDDCPVDDNNDDGGTDDGGSDDGGNDDGGTDDGGSDDGGADDGDSDDDDDPKCRRGKRKRRKQFIRKLWKLFRPWGFRFRGLFGRHARRW